MGFLKKFPFEDKIKGLLKVILKLLKWQNLCKIIKVLKYESLFKMYFKCVL